MSGNDLVLQLKDELMKYIHIRNNVIKNLVFDLNEISGDKFLKDARLTGLISNYPEIQNLLKYLLKNAPKRKVNRQNKYTNYNGGYKFDDLDYDNRDIGIEEDYQNHTPYNIDEEQYDDGSCMYDSDNAFYD